MRGLRTSWRPSRPPSRSAPTPRTRTGRSTCRPSPARTSTCSSGSPGRGRLSSGEAPHTHENYFRFRYPFLFRLLRRALSSVCSATRSMIVTLSLPSGRLLATAIEVERSAVGDGVEEGQQFRRRGCVRPVVPATPELGPGIQHPRTRRSVCGQETGYGGPVCATAIFPPHRR